MGIFKSVILLMVVLFAVASNASVEELLNEEVSLSGPNCSNAALRALDLMPHRRYVHNSEFFDFLKLNCQEQGGALLGAIFVKEDQEPLHVFVRLGGSDVFTKNGASKRSKNIVQTYPAMYAKHKKASRSYCVLNQIENCSLEVKYFSCTKPMVALEKLEEHVNFMGRDREHFFNEQNQSKLKEMITQIDWAKNCGHKKKKLLSFILTVNLATMSNNGKEEYDRSKVMERNLRFIYEGINCN